LLEDAEAAELSALVCSGGSGADASPAMGPRAVVASAHAGRPELLDRVWLCAAASDLCSRFALPSVQQITAITVEPMSLFLMRYLGQ
jgi:hypothetical protein